LVFFFFSAALSHALSLDASGNFMNYVKIIKMLLKLHGEKNKTKKMSQESSRKVKENTKCNLLAESVTAIGSSQSPENSNPHLSFQRTQSGNCITPFNS